MFFIGLCGSPLNVVTSCWCHDFEWNAECTIWLCSQRTHHVSSALLVDQVVVVRLDTPVVSEHQVLDDERHGNLAFWEVLRRIERVRADALIDVRLQHSDCLDVVDAILLLPEEELLVLLLQTTVLRHDLSELTGLRTLDDDQLLDEVHAIRAVEHDRRGLDRSDRHQRCIANAVCLQTSTKTFPIELVARREVSQLVHALCTLLPREDAFAVGRCVGHQALALLLCQIARSVCEVEGEVLHPLLDFSQRFRLAVDELALGVPVGEIGDANTERLIFLVVQLAVNGHEVLVLQQIVQATKQHTSWLAHLFWIAHSTNVDRAERAQCDTTVRVFKRLERTSVLHDFRAEIRLIDRADFWIERALIGNVVDVQNVVATRVRTLLDEHVLDERLSAHRLLAKRLVLLVLGVELLELGCVSVERVVQVRHFVWIEEGQCALLLEATPHEGVDDNAIVEVTNARLFGALIVLQHHEVVDLVMPEREVHGRIRVANAAL